MMLLHDSHARTREHIVKLLLSETVTAINVFNEYTVKSVFCPFS
jgi:hypothetical protein